MLAASPPPGNLFPRVGGVAWLGEPLDHLDDGANARVCSVDLSGLRAQGVQARGDAARGFLCPSRLDLHANRLAKGLSPRLRHRAVEFCIPQAEYARNERLVPRLAEVDLSRHLVAPFEAATRDQYQEHGGSLDAPPDVLDVVAAW